jgi:hypothetical protein
LNRLLGIICICILAKDTLLHAGVITSEQISLYRSLFRGRTDVYAKLWQNPAANRMGYAPVFTIDQQPAGLTDAAISAHLNGSITIGIYPLLNDNSSYFIAADFDHGDWLQEANRFCKSAASCSVPAYIERSRSGDGAHVWIFFQTNIPAVKARQLGHLLLERAGITRRQSYDRLFPSQDFHTGRGFGNLIALPLHGKMLNTGKTAFVDEHGGSFPDQWRVLKETRKVTELAIDRILGVPKTAAKKPGVHSAASDEGVAETHAFRTSFFPRPCPQA